MNTESNPKPKKKKHTKFQSLEAAAKEIRDYPLIPIEAEQYGFEGTGFIGEIMRLKTGEWEARRYGSNYQTDRAKYPDAEQALTFFKSKE